MWESANYFSRSHDITVVSTRFEPQIPNVNWRPIPDRREVALRHFAAAAAPVVTGVTSDLVIGFGAECPPVDVAWVNSVHREWLRQSTKYAKGGLRRFGRHVLPRHRDILRMERRYYSNPLIRRFFTASDHVAKELDRHYQVGRDRCVTVPNGYSSSEFSPALRRAHRTEMRRQFRFGDDDVVLLMVANELKRKGFPTLVRAVAAVGDERLKILLVGRGDPAPWANLLGDLRMGDRVVYAGPTDDVARAHAAGDVFVLPTQYEAACLAIVEALASGLPVITTSVPGAGDLVTDGVSGLILDDPVNADALAGLLATALDADLRSTWSEGAVAAVRGHEWSSVLAHAENLLLPLAS